GSDRFVLAAACGLALSVQRLSAVGSSAAARPVAAHGTRGSVTTLRLVVGAGGGQLLLLLHPPGVLHLPGVSGPGPACRRVTGARRESEIALGAFGARATRFCGRHGRRRARFSIMALAERHAGGRHLADAHA